MAWNLQETKSEKKVPGAPERKRGREGERRREVMEETTTVVTKIKQNKRNCVKSAQR